MTATGKIISGSMKPVQSTYVDYYERNSTYKYVNVSLQDSFMLSVIQTSQQESPIYSPVYWSIWKVSPTRNGTGN